MHFFLYLLLQDYTSYPIFSYIFVHLKYRRLSIYIILEMTVRAGVRIECVKIRSFLSRYTLSTIYAKTDWLVVLQLEFRRNTTFILLLSLKYLSIERVKPKN